MWVGSQAACGEITESGITNRPNNGLIFCIHIIYKYGCGFGRKWATFGPEVFVFLFLIYIYIHTRVIFSKDIIRVYIMGTYPFMTKGHNM